MGLFSGLFRSRDKPKNKTVGSSYTFYMGGSTAGKPVTERSAMQMTAVYSCVRIRAEAIAGLPSTFTDTHPMVVKKKRLTIPFICFSTMNPTPKCQVLFSGRRL